MDDIRIGLTVVILACILGHVKGQYQNTCPDVCRCDLMPNSKDQSFRKAECTAMPKQQLHNTIKILTVKGHLNQVTQNMISTLGTSLIQLDLSNCYINSIEPGAFNSLTHLIKLILSNNNINQIDSEFSCPHLQELYLDGNGLKAINTASFSQLTRLRELHLENNELRNISTIPSSVQVLDVSNNKLHTIKMDLSTHKIKSMLYVTSGAFGFFAAFSIYKGNERFYDNILMPLLHTLNPETSHNIAIFASKYGLIPQSASQDPATLETQVWQMKFSNPVGIAAGFDKQGEVVESLHKIGFGFVEIGSVTPVPQPGNEKPRVFRLQKDEAVINRYGFNSDGHEVVYNRLKLLKAKASFTGIVGVNLGKNKSSKDPVKDYVDGIKKFGDIADYLVINISSPNTPGLRSWQKKQQLEELLNKLVAARNDLKVPKKPPLLLKLAPDLSQEERKDIADVLKDKKCRVDGLVISNTTIERMPGLSDTQATEEGGLSGKPLTDLSTELIADMYRLTEGKLPIIGVGGIFSGKDAFDKIKAGASLVQLYTSFIYHGPPRISRVKRELDEHIRMNELKSVAEAVGKSHSSRK